MQTAKMDLTIGVLSDTHIPARAKKLPDAVMELFAGLNAVFHAGDFIRPAVFLEIEKLAPAYGVLGNVDSADVAALVPERQSVELGGIRIGMIHDSGPTAGRRSRMNEMFPGHRVVIFGHSHRPFIEDEGGLLLINPGSACDPRWARVPTVAILSVQDGRPKARLVEI